MMFTIRQSISPIEHINLRGGRMVKMGKHAVSFAPVLGLVGAAAVFGAGEASANQCGSMPAGGGVVVCDTTSYGTANGAPSGEGAGTELDPAITGIFYNSAFTNDPSLTVNSLFLDVTTGNAVRIQNSGSVASSITVNDSFIHSSALAVSLQDGAANATGHYIAINGETEIVSDGVNGRGVNILVNPSVITWTGASQVTLSDAASIETTHDVVGSVSNAQGINVDNRSPNAVGSITVSLEDQSSIITHGQNSFGVNAVVSGANAEIDIDVEMTGAAAITTNGFNGRGIYLNMTSAVTSNTTGDMRVRLAENASITTFGELDDVRAYGFRSPGVLVINDSATAGTIALLIEGDATIDTWSSSSSGLQGIQAGAGSSGDTFIEARGNARIHTRGYNSAALFARQSGAGASGDTVVRVSENVSITTQGDEAVGAVARSSGVGNTGLVAVYIDGTTNISTSGTNSDGVYAFQDGFGATGDVGVVIGDSATINTSGDGSVSVHAVQSSNTATGDLNIVVGTDATIANTGTDGFNGVQSHAIKGSVAGTGNLSLTVDGTVSSVATNTATIFGLINNGASTGTATISVNGDVTSTGDGSIGVSGIHFGNGLTTIALGVDSSITSGALDGSNSGVTAVSGSGFGSGDVIINAAGTVAANGIDAVGIGAVHSGTGDIKIASVGDVTAIGDGAFGIAIDTTNSGVNFELDLDAGSVSGDQAAVNIDTGTGSTGLVNIASGATVGSLTDSMAINMTGSGTANVTNGGAMLGGVNVLGDFVNAVSATVTVSGGQGFSVSNDLVNNGLIDAADGVTGDVIAVGGDLSGNGKVKIDVDAIVGASDTITVGGDVTAGTNLVVNTNVTAGNITSDTADVLANILTVNGTVAQDATYVINAGLLSFGFENVDGIFLAPVITVADEAQVYTAMPTVLASNFNRIGSTQTRWVNRVYARSADINDVSSIALSTRGAVTSNFLGGGQWASISTERMKSSRSTGAMHSDGYVEFEGGYDAAFGMGNGATLVIGGSAHVGQLSSEVVSAAGTGSDILATGLGLGINATYVLPSGTYFDGALRATSTGSDIATAGTALISDLNAVSLTGAVEAGHRFALAAGSSITPSAQLTLGRTFIDGFTDINGIVVEKSEQDTHKVRVGATYERALDSSNEGSTFRASADLIHNYSSANEITASNTLLSSDGVKDWVEVGLGTTLNLADNARIAFDVSYAFAPEKPVDNNGLRASLGYQMKW